jgi:biopolymer transport protein ExbD
LPQEITMRIRHNYTALDKVEMQMTPMIDIVFQLNIFFLFSLKIISPEGDFNIRMPSAAAARSVQQSESLPRMITLKAAPDGRLAELRLDSQSFGNGRDAFARLHQAIRNYVNDTGGPGTASELEVEINADYDLQYDYVVKAITAVTGYIENGEAHKLIERVKFTPPKKAGE